MSLPAGMRSQTESALLCFNFIMSVLWLGLYDNSMSNKTESTLLARGSSSVGFNPHVRQHSFMETGHEIISTTILSLPLIQEGQLSANGERMCTQYS